MTPRSAMENPTPDDVATITVAAAVPGPHSTSAAVPTNSAATFRDSDASALEVMDRPAAGGRRAAGGASWIRTSVRARLLGQPLGRQAHRLGKVVLPLR